MTKHAAETEQLRSTLGLEEAWAGNPAGVRKFLAFCETQFLSATIATGMPIGIVLRLDCIRKEVASLQHYIDGYLARQDDQS